MTIEKIDNNKARLLLTYLIVSDKFIEELYPILEEHKNIIYNSFNSFQKTILNWCLEYFKKYNKAPNVHIKEIFNENKIKLKSEDQELISDFLQYLSDKYVKENINEQYVLDLSLKYLREINLDLLQKQIQEHKNVNEIDEAEHLVLTYEKLDKETEIKQETKLLSDVETARAICDFQLNQNEDDRLFKLNGDLGNKLGWIYREDFFSFISPAKRGKSFYLREIALICIKHGLNVVIFNLEMSHAKYLRNFYQNLSAEVKNKPEEFESVKLPYFEKNANGKFDIKYEEIKKFGLSGRKIKGVFRKEKITNKGDIIVRSFPSNTLTFQKMSKCLDEYALQGFAADVVLIDFLDNLKSFTKEYRHSIDEKWTNARRLAQEKHIAVGTVSHTSKKNFNKDIDAGDVNEDYRKENHVTHMLALNQTPEEKEKQITRINIIHNRDEDFNRHQMFYCLECRAIGKVLLDTLSSEKVNYFTKKAK